jgi:hypothetical protein
LTLKGISVFPQTKSHVLACVCRVEQPEEGANVIVYETSVYEKKSIGLARTIHKQLTSLFIWFAYSVHHYCVHHCSMLIPVCIIPVCINTVCFIKMCLQCASLLCASLQYAYYSVLITVCSLHFGQCKIGPLHPSLLNRIHSLGALLQQKPMLA